MKGVSILIETVVFDIDDTIYDQQEPFRKAVQKLFPLVSEEDMLPLYTRFRVHSDANFNKVITQEWTLEYMRSHRISQSLKDLDYPHITDEEALTFQEVYEAKLDAITMHQEVEKTLDFLKSKKVPVSIITNGPTDHQYKKILQLGLLNWVSEDNIIISQATGYEKPDVEIFELEKKQFSLNPENSLYVGDNFNNDVIGSKRAGWQSLWLNHRNRQLPKGTSQIQDIELTSFDQLLPTFQHIFA